MQNNNKKHSIVDYLKYIYRWNMVVVIMSVLSCVVSIYIFVDNTFVTRTSEKELTELQDSISKNVLKIKMTFNKDSIGYDSLADSTFYDIMEFEKSTYMFAKAWDEYIALPSVAGLKPNNVKDVIEYFRHYSSITLKFNEAQQKVIEDIQKLASNEKNERKVIIVSRMDKLLAFQNQYIEWMDVHNSKQQEIILNLNRIEANKENKTKEIVKAIMPFDEIKNDPRLYRCENLLFSYCIDLKQIYDRTYKTN